MKWTGFRSWARGKACWVSTISCHSFKQLIKPSMSLVILSHSNGYSIRYLRFLKETRPFIPRQLARGKLRRGSWLRNAASSLSGGLVGGAPAPLLPPTPPWCGLEIPELFPRLSCLCKEEDALGPLLVQRLCITWFRLHNRRGKHKAVQRVYLSLSEC